MNKSLQRNLRRYRYAKGLDQCELAKLTGLSTASISYFERGLRVPRIENISRIAAALGVTEADLLAEDRKKAR